MSLQRKNELVTLSLWVIVAFGMVWWFVSAVTPPWCDEPRNLLAAQSLAVSGQPEIWDYSNDKPENFLYTRGLVITYPLAFLYKHHLTLLIWARAIPLVFVLLTLGFWVFYLRYKGLLDTGGTALLFLFFLGQPMVLEQASFVRMYAPLGLVFSILTICLWELKEACKAKRWGISLGLVVLFILGFWVPHLDSWQLQYIPHLVLALAMLNKPIWKWCIGWVRKPIWSLLFLISMIWIGPIGAILLNHVIPIWAHGFGIIIGRIYNTYWDNVAGMIRFLLAVNIMLIGLRWIYQKPDQQGLFRWLYLSGLLAGIFLAILTPPQYIYFSRYFYLPIITVTVGFAGMCAEELNTPWVKRNLIIAYLVFSGLFTFVNFYYERSNLPVAVHWLKENMGPHDVLLYCNYFYGLNDGEDISGKNVYLITDIDIDKVIDFVSAPGVGHVYFLLNNNFKFRNRLYAITTGRHRWAVRNQIADYLDYNVSGRQVLPGLRGCDLKEFEWRQVVAALDKLKVSVPSSMPVWRLSRWQRNIGLSIEKLFGPQF